MMVGQVKGSRGLKRPAQGAEKGGKRPKTSPATGVVLPDSSNGSASFPVASAGTSATTGATARNHGAGSSGYDGQDYRMLVDLFPDCDTEFLQQKLTTFMQEAEVYDLDVLVSQLLETKYLKIKKKSATTQKKLMIEYLMEGEVNDVEEYLRVIPEPEKTFMTPTKTAEMSALYKEHCTSQLYNDFRNVSVTSINDVLTKSGGRYGPAWLQLQTATRKDSASARGKQGSLKYIKSKRQEHTMPADPCEQFYRELQYIKNRDKVIGHIKNKKTERASRLSEARGRGELETCSCCYDDEVLFEEMEACEEGHVFCAECVRRSVEVGVGEDKVKHLCLHKECEAEFSMATLRRVLKPATLSLLLRKLQEEEIRLADIENLVSCPFCPFSTIMDNPDDKVFTCLNPDCMRQSCRLCKEENHVPLRCDEIEKDGERSMRAFIERKMSEAMIRKCHVCNRRFYKVEGCNTMTCVCGAQQCYVCRASIKGYQHFQKAGGCNLWDMNKLHLNEMKKAADEARLLYIKEHPEAASIALKNDPLVLIGAKKINKKGRKPIGLFF